MYALDNQSFRSEYGSGRSIAAIQPAESGDQTRLLATLTSAFVNDPPVRWLYPEADSYLRHYPVFAKAFGGVAFEFGSVWRSEAFEACALWCPPGIEPDEEAVITVIEDTVKPWRHAEVFALFEAMGEAHPTELHWYLPLIGVDMASQGRGLGSVLLRETLAQCDRAGLPTYLEASNPRNILFYERHGFTKREALSVGSCPPIVPMWREPTYGTEDF